MQVNHVPFFQIGQSGYPIMQNSQKQNSYVWQASRREEDRGDGAQAVRERRRMLSESRREACDLYGSVSSDGKKTYQGGTQSGIVSDSISYASRLRASRAKAKDTSLKLKRLRYNFKSISSQILRSKTSNSARQVAGKARREVVRLKRLRQNGEYDAEELQSAILHAQAMERVAKKKARHLLEEELAKAGEACLGELEEKELSGDEAEELAYAFLQGSLEESTEASAESIEQMEAMLEKLESVGLSESLDGERLEGVSDMMDEMWESMQDLMEEMGLEDLTEGLTGTDGRDMDPADLKMMKLKHRLKELKEIAEADSEYLKALFDKLAKESAEAPGGGASTGSNSIGSGSVPAPVGGGIPAGGGALSFPAGMGAGLELSGGIDVSV